MFLIPERGVYVASLFYRQRRKIEYYASLCNKPSGETNGNKGQFNLTSSALGKSNAAVDEENENLERSELRRKRG